MRNAAITVVASQHTLHAFDGNGLAICWAGLGLAFFALGLTTKHRIHRLGGLLLLAMALGHILCIDVWKLGTILRILSFFTVGMALLALGFIERQADALVLLFLGPDGVTR